MGHGTQSSSRGMLRLHIAAICFMAALPYAPLSAIAAEKQPIIDPKTKQYTDRGRALSLIAAAGVVEVLCFADGRLAAAVAKAHRMGVAVDLNDMDDNTSIAKLMDDFKKSNAEMGARWCEETLLRINRDIDSP